MNINVNPLEISVSNYYMSRIKDKSKIESENLLSSKNDINKTIYYRCSNHLRASMPINCTKYSKKINQDIKSIKHDQFLSPKSKVKISYLNHFNNNKIYYSNQKKVDFEKKKAQLNTEIKSNRKRLIFENEKKNQSLHFKHIIEIQKNKDKIYNNQKTEDSKNNDIILNNKSNVISSYKFFRSYDNEIINNKRYLHTNKKIGSPNLKQKLLKMISKKNIFNIDKKEKINELNSSRQNKNDIINKITKKINKIKTNSEIINPEEYIKLKKIGEGSFGKIFKAKWIQNNKNYALKEMHFQSEDNLLYLKKKLKLIMDLQKKAKCDGLIKIKGYSESKKKKDYYFYEIMELAERDWEQEISNRKKFYKFYTEKELFSIIKQLINTLSLLQQNHITHRDIKLQNILIINNKYKICDFGESRSLSQKGTIVQPVRGSELYMSPILFSGLNNKLLQVTHNTYKSDMFSVGMCILYAATLTCNSLYDIREMDDMNNIRSVLNNYMNGKYSNNFIEILMCMLEVNEKKRPDFIQMEKVITHYENVCIN